MDRVEQVWLGRGMTEKQLTISEAAKALGVSIQTVRRWEAQGKISAARTLGDQRRFAQSEIDRAKGGAS